MKKPSIHITLKNMKMTVPCWSITAGSSCPGATPMCLKRCYALKTERIRPNAAKRRAANMTATAEPHFAEDMVSMVRIHHTAHFRIHEGGDFYAQEYLDAWFKVCRALPEVRFLAFTKMFGLDWSKKPKNLTIFWSVWPDTPAETIPLKGPYAFAGACQTMPPGTRECPGHCDNCMACWDNPRSVHFKIH